MEFTIRLKSSGGQWTAEVPEMDFTACADTVPEVLELVAGEVDEEVFIRRTGGWTIVSKTLPRS